MDTIKRFLGAFSVSETNARRIPRERAGKRERSRISVSHVLKWVQRRRRWKRGRPSLRHHESRISGKRFGSVYVKSILNAAIYVGVLRFRDEYSDAPRECNLSGMSLKSYEITSPFAVQTILLILIYSLTINFRYMSQIKYKAHWSYYRTNGHYCYVWNASVITLSSWSLTIQCLPTCKIYTLWMI